jgi:hypothetical protein
MESESHQGIGIAGMPSGAATPVLRPRTPWRTRAQRTWIRVRGPFFRVAACAAILFTVAGEAYTGAAASDLAIRRALGGAGFDFVGWEVDALARKGADLITRPGDDLDAAAQTDLVRAYFAAILRIRDLNRAIEGIYADPAVADHAAAAAPLQAELAALRADQDARRPAVERILERQTAQLLADEGLTTLGGVFPPVRFRFTESPNLLILSPRERILLEESVHVDPALALDRIEQIEARLQGELDRSTLIEDTGGISTYPTMVVEEPSLEWVMSTIAHEWAHTYLFFRPLGRHYYDSGEMRTINETTASIIGDELGRRLMLRYYPDLVGPEAWPRPRNAELRWWEQTPEDRPFEFGAFMRAARLEADRLLAEGKVEEAEATMEARRQELVARGYDLRKLNQAYFAFHGSYAVGSAATDPLGGKLRALRERSASLNAFVRAVSAIASAADLDAALERTP